MSDATDRLRAFLRSQAPGEIDNCDAVCELLAACWDQIANSSETAMSKSKIARIEQVKWQPPQLCFIIERHGGTVLGSTRADVHKWVIDIDKFEAQCDEHYTYRQLYKQDSPLDTRVLAEEIAVIVVAGADDDRLKWSADRSRVQILVGRFIPGQFQQTITRRRRKFREMVDAKLQSEGWKPVESRPNVYERKNYKVE